MRKLQIFTGVVLLAIVLLIACDDFFSPTIEIFNKVKNPVNIEQIQKEETNQTDVKQVQTD